MKKRLLSILLALCLCAALLPTFAAADTPTLQGSGTAADPWILTQDSFTKAGTPESPVGTSYGVYLLPSGCYKLGENLTLYASIHISPNADVTLDLNGFTLRREKGHAIDVTNGYDAASKGFVGSTFTLTDSSLGKTGTISNGYVYVDVDSTFTMNGGTISGAKYGVCNYKGTFNMTDGKIINCTTGIFNDGGTVTLPGGTTLDCNVINTWNFPFAGNTFKGEVQHGVMDACPINGGTFFGVVRNGELIDGNNRAGLITGGVFRNEVFNYAEISVGRACESEIAGGVFYEEVTNMHYISSYGNEAKAKITGGVFYGQVKNDGEITGGVFLGGITGNGIIEGTQHSITVDLGDGTTRSGVVVGNTLYPLGEPPVQREGYNFVGWFEENGNPWNFAEQPEELDGFKLTAKWEKIPDEPAEGGSDGLTELLAGLLASLPEMPFEDVHSSDYFYNAVCWAYGSGVTGGTDRTHFSPNAGCTRAQAVTFLWRALGCPAASYPSSFADVDRDAYYASAVDWAVSSGVTKGTSAASFSPDAACSRGEIVTLLCRALGGAAAEAAPFADVPAGAYYADAVAWAYGKNITGGTDEAHFSPAAPCTRAQIVTFLYRALGK